MRIQRVPIYLAVFIGLVIIGGFVGAAAAAGELGANTTVSNETALPIGELGGNTTVSNGTAAPIGELGANTTVSNGTAAPIGELGVNATVAGEISPDLDGTATTAPPVARLSVSPVVSEEKPALLCTGNVTADGRPVAGATVHLTFDDYGVLDCTTGEDGAFSMLVRIGPGRHSVVANVSLADRPQSPVLSPRMTAEIPGALPLLPMGVGVIALLVGGTGFFFWRRGRGQEKEEPEPEASLPAEAVPVVVAEDLHETARTLAAGELRQGIEAVYRESLVRLDLQQPDARLLTRTPREVRKQFEGTPIAAPVGSMTEIYEAVVYSGRTAVEKDRRAMIDLFVAVFSGSERADR